MIIIHKRSIDLARREIPATIDTVQDDCGRVLALKLYADGIPWPIPDGVCAVVHYCKADGTGGEYDTLPDGSCAWSASGNMLHLALAPQVLTAAGRTQLSVKLSDGANTVSTFALELNVLPGLRRRKEESESYSNVAAFLTAPRSAEAGQYLRVLQVDPTGRVVALETVDAPAAAGETELIGKKIISGEIRSIVLLGDSITDGAGGSDYNGSFLPTASANTDGYCWANAFRKFTAERYGTTAHNKGMYGTVMATQKNAALEFLTKNDFVIWLTGTNDRWDSSSYKAALAANIKEIQGKCAGVLVISGIPSTADDEAEKPATMQNMDEIIMGQLAGQVPCFSMYQAMVGYCERQGIALADCFADHVHPNDLGYFIMFTLLCEKLGLPLDPYTDYRYSGSWWGGTGGDSGDPGEEAEDVLLLDSTDDYNQTPVDFVYLLEDIVPVVLMDGYDSEAKTTVLSGKTVSRVILDVREAGTITIGTVDLTQVGAAAPVFTQSATIAAANTGFVEFTLNMQVGANETLAFQQLSDTGHLGFVVMSGDLFIWQSKDFAAGAKSTDLILYGKIYTK